MTLLLPRLSAELIGTPLLVEQGYLDHVLTALADRLDIDPILAADAFKPTARPDRSVDFDKSTGIAIMPLVGGLSHRGGYTAMSGNTGYTGIQGDIQGLLERGAKGIVFDVDSPGGAVSGLQATGDFIKNLGVPTYAVSNSTMASAAYWLGSTAKRVFAAPGSSTGSIGVVTAHRDMSGAMAKAGIVHTYISAGKGKVDGNPYEPLSDDLRAAIQASIDEVYSEFVGHVAGNRGISGDSIRNFGASMFGPKDAQKHGLVDAVASLDEVVASMKTNLYNPTSVGFFSTPNAGATGLSENLVFSQNDLDKAVASAVADAKANTSSLTAAVAKARGEIAADYLHALTEIFGEDPRALAFAEVLEEGGSVALATKMAKKFAAPVAATAEVTEAQMQAHLERKFGAAAPNVPSDVGRGAVGGDVATEASARAARKLELQAAGKSIGKVTHA